MKKVICKYEYDTDKAVIIKKYTSGSFGDVAGYEETLYQTVDGKYFIYYNGGQESQYPREDIKRIAKEKADSWVTEHVQ